MWQRKTDDRHENGKKYCKANKKTWDKKVCVCVRERERAGKRWPWFLSRKEKPNTLGSCGMCIEFSSALSITRK